MSIKNKLHILGYGEWLGYAHLTAIELGHWSEIVVNQIEKINEYTYDLNPYQKCEQGVEYFLALNGDAFGTVREKHLSNLVSRGFPMASLMPNSIEKKINCLISTGAIIPRDLKISFNVFLGPNSIIGRHVTLGRSSTVGGQSLLMDEVGIGKNVTLSNDTRVESKVSIDSYCSIEFPSHIKSNINSGRIESQLFERPVQIMDAQKDGI